MEVGRLAFQEKFFQNHLGHGHGQGAVGPGPGGQPGIGELDIFRIIRGHRHDLGASIPGFRIKMGVRSAGLGDVGAPANQVGGMVPVGAFRHVRLFTPNLGRSRRQIAIPVVETEHGGADEGEKPRPGGITDHGHGRNGGEAEDPVRSIFFNGVDQRGGDQGGGLVPGNAHQSAFAPRTPRYFCVLAWSAMMLPQAVTGSGWAARASCHSSNKVERT